MLFFSRSTAFFKFFLTVRYINIYQYPFWIQSGTNNNVGILLVQLE